MPFTWKFKTGYQSLQSVCEEEQSKGTYSAKFYIRHYTLLTALVAC